MTRATRTRPQSPPLAEQIRAALAQGWHTLDALSLLAGRAPAARHRVHAALAELRAGGVVLEERVTRGVAEVRLLTLPAPRYTLSPETIAELGGPAEAAAAFAETEGVAVDLDAFDAMARGDALLAATALDATPPDAGQGPAVEAADGAATGARERTASEWIASHNHEPAPVAKGPGPSSRCAHCGEQYARHGDGAGREPHPFQPKPRGRPRVAAVASEPPPDVPTDEGAEPPPCPPCIDCGEEPGSCPEGRCRDCDIEHLMSAGSCRECLTWIMREEMAGPREKQHSIGCSLAADPCYPRNAAEYIATRKARYGWTPPPGWTLTGWAADAAAAEPETSRGEAPGEQDHGKQEQGEAPDVGTTDDGAEGERARSRAAGCRKSSRSVSPRGDKGVSGDNERARGRAPRRGGKVDEPVGLTRPPACRPPACHWDDIIEPARVRAWARPLCERHRRWVEGAGGTVAAGGLAGVVLQ